MNTASGNVALQAALHDRFLIKSEIGQGGQAIVFLGQRKTTTDGAPCDDEVAIKLYKAGSDEVRVDREIDALRGFEHPCLSRFLEHGAIAFNNERLKYVVWAYVDGRDLRHVLAAGPATAILVAIVGRDISRAVEHLWTKRIVHRDINPRNIIVRNDGGGAVLIDLGIARYLDHTTITPPGLTWGTWGYLSPEQWRAATVSCMSDVYSLGISLQEALCGKHPTQGNQEAIVRLAPRTSTIAPAAPAALAETIDACLAVRAAFRPTPSELSQRFAEIAELLR